MPCARVPNETITPSGTLSSKCETVTSLNWEYHNFHPGVDVRTENGHGLRERGPHHGNVDG